MAGCAKSSGTVTVLDSQGNTLICLRENRIPADDSRWAYIQLAVDEAARQLAQARGCTQQEAVDQLFSGQYTVYTAFSPAVHQAITAAMESRSLVEVGCAVTDLRGNLLAAYSGGDTTNYATSPTAPYSAFKPLSVYLPAVESGRAGWFTTYEDSPLKQIPAEGGGMQDWPSNATGKYSMQTVPVHRALAQSLNTVAVKCLADLGVETSMAFLQDKLGIPLAEETQVLEQAGPDEILGNIALGYLETGVSPVDMAGYYQIFGSGGRYTKPQAVTKICDASGGVLYQREHENRQVTSPEVADIMNRLLQGVVKTGGTGEQATVPGTQVAGKTGTGDNYAGNWFVGLIPGYSCAVWHGEDRENKADELFSRIMTGVLEEEEEPKREFYAWGILNQVVYCAESGMPISDDCTRIELGYLLPGTSERPCNIHD